MSHVDHVENFAVLHKIDLANRIYISWQWRQSAWPSTTQEAFVTGGLVWTKVRDKSRSEIEGVWLDECHTEEKPIEKEEPIDIMKAVRDFCR